MLKKILPDIQGQEEFVQMFLDEARVTAAFNHPNIAQVFDLDVAGGELFLAMEFVPGATLLEVARACLGAKEPMPMGLGLAAVRDTALALHYAHTFTDALGEPSPVIHRDVAEKNIMVTYEGVTKLLDFGIAKSLMEVSRTQVGMVKGTSGYMSPEQILGQPLDARSDLFSLGVVLHECLTGARLFPGKAPAAVMNAVLRGPIPEPSRANKAVPPELDAIVLKALSRQREDRYATTLEFARELERAVSGLIWLPEQSGALLRRLFAERREQTRQVLAGGRTSTGEVKLPLPPAEPREGAKDAAKEGAPATPAPRLPAITATPAQAPAGPRRPTRTSSPTRPWCLLRRLPSPGVSPAPPRPARPRGPPRIAHGPCCPHPPAAHAGPRGAPSRPRGEAGAGEDGPRPAPALHDFREPRRLPRRQPLRLPRGPCFPRPRRQPPRPARALLLPLPAHARPAHLHSGRGHARLRHRAGLRRGQGRGHHPAPPPSLPAPTSRRRAERGLVGIPHPPLPDPSLPPPALPRAEDGGGAAAVLGHPLHRGRELRAGAETGPAGAGGAAGARGAARRPALGRRRGVLVAAARPGGPARSQAP
ncbi:protein kinase domain-containing protein [Cystobacter fuscus]